MSLLSKSRFVAGIQCHKRLYFECHRRELADPVDDATQARFDIGHQVGELARGLRPAGVLIAEVHLHHKEAMISTQKALEDPSVPALYEAAFEHQGVAIRADILAKTADGQFDLIEVKSSTKLKPQYEPDVAIQLWVLEGCGLPIQRAMLAHIDNSYVYKGGDYDLDRLFLFNDITAAVRQNMPSYLAQLDTMREMLAQDETPEIGTGPHCSKPYHCNYWGHCHADEPLHPIDDLYRLGDNLRDDLIASGIDSIDQIPAEYHGLSMLQARMRDCVSSGSFFLDPAIEQKLRAWGRPLFFLDFETIAPALPRYVNTRPYETIPFQWSLHKLDRDGAVQHHEYLHDGTDDPRPQLAQQLVEAVGDQGAIVHYTGYEARVISDLADAVPDQAAALIALNGRLVDFAPEIREHYYHPEQHGSFSLKTVLPSVLPGEGYAGLDIADGISASVAYAELLDTELLPEQRAQLRADLLAYCQYDTEALLKLYQVLYGDA